MPSQACTLQAETGEQSKLQIRLMDSSELKKKANEDPYFQALEKSRFTDRISNILEEMSQQGNSPH